MVSNETPFNYNQNNLNLDFSFSINDEAIYIKAKMDENNYQGIFSLNCLQEKDKYFKLFDTIDEASLSLLEYVRNNKYEINLKDNDILLIISVQYNNKFSPISFLLKLIPKKKEECIKETFEISKNIMKENIELKQKIVSLEQTYQNKFRELNEKMEKILGDNKELKDKVDKNTNLLNNMLELLEKMEGENRNNMNSCNISQKYIESFQGSNIIKSDLQIEKLIEWICPNKSETKFKLIYNARLNGDKRSDFINKCVDKNKLVIIFSTEKGDIMGAYIEEKIVDDGSWVDDAKAFLFNLTFSEKYKIIKEKNNYAYFLVNYYGPLFGYNNNQYNILIDDNILSSDNHSYFPTQTHFQFPPNRVKDEKEFFKIKEFEVYQVI